MQTIIRLRLILYDAAGLAIFKDKLGKVIRRKAILEKIIACDFLETLGTKLFFNQEFQTFITIMKIFDNVCC